MTFDDLSGQKLSQYELREPLGVGGMGAVYRGYQITLKREVAIKVLPAALALQPGYLERFAREAETAAALEHPHIVPIVDYGAQRSISYIVMRLLTGGTLTQRLAERANTAAPLPSLREIADLVKELASALDYAHSQGVIHRDIKPSNIMFDNQGNSYLVDFGIAKLLGATSQGLTGTGNLIGTPSYMAPEQWRGDDLTPAADQYALGVLAYSLITGHVPFEAATPYALMNKHLNETPVPLQTLRADVPASVGQVLQRALAKQPKDRYPGVMAFSQALTQSVVGIEGKSSGFYHFKLGAEPTATKQLNQPPARKITESEVEAIDSEIPKSDADKLATNLPLGGSRSTVRPSRNLFVWVAGLVLLIILLIALVVVAMQRNATSTVQTPTQIAAVISATTFTPLVNTATNTPTAINAIGSTTLTTNQIESSAVASFLGTNTASATSTNTALPPTATATYTALPPTSTDTFLPPTATYTVIPPSRMPTNTSIPLIYTPTRTPIASTATPTATQLPTIVMPTNTPIPPTYTLTYTPIVSTATPTATPIPPTRMPTNTPFPATATFQITAIPNTPTSQIAVLVVSPTVSQLPTLAATVTPKLPSKTPTPGVTTTATAIPTNIGGGKTGKIIFDVYRSANGKGQISVVNADGSDEQQLTTDTNNNDSNAHLSPDGKHIVFDSDRSGRPQLYIMDSDGQNVKALTTGTTPNLNPFWSPDGKQIVYCTAPYGKYEIAIMESDGQDARQLTRTGRDNYVPAWSPDGKQIVFQANYNGHWHLYATNADGSNFRIITNSSWDDLEPTWSPDSKLVVFRSDQRGMGQIFTINIKTLEEHQVSHDPLGAGRPVWSPDGTLILYNVAPRDATHGRTLYVMNADGTNPRPAIKSAPYNIGAESWGP